MFAPVLNKRHLLTLTTQQYISVKGMHAFPLKQLISKEEVVMFKRHVVGNHGTFSVTLYKDEA